MDVATHSLTRELSADELLRLKKKHIKIEVAIRSQLPYRVTRRRNGVIISSFETHAAAEEFVVVSSLQTLGIK